MAYKNTHDIVVCEDNELETTRTERMKQATAFLDHTAKWHAQIQIDFFRSLYEVLMTDNGKYPRLSIRLNTQLEKAITANAKTRGISRASIVRDALYQYFEELDKSNSKPKGTV